MIQSDTKPMTTDGGDIELFIAVSRAAQHLINQQSWRDGLGDFLRVLGEHTDTNRVWVFEVLEQGPDHYVTHYLHEWSSSPQYSNIADQRYVEHRVEIREPELRVFYQARLQGQVLKHQRSEVTGHLKREFDYQGIESMLTIPIMVEGEWWGILGFDDCARSRTYPESYVAALEIAAVLITNAILRERLQWEVHHDHLTGLLNRRALIERIEQQLVETPEQGSLVIIDIDWFKQVNDAYGHQAGDEVLKSFSQRLQSQLPEEALLARFGGEEFALWLPANGPKARYIAEQLRQSLNESAVPWRDHQITLTASFGIAEMRATKTLYSASALFEHVFGRADQALFQAKAQGRNCIVYSD
ncbi:MAG: sensor domain-containing diguanylate cyclase [Saccharospirillum sp.]|nr:sensor domain-containing diguanylate cyclase [Saccharospirillum sp.]